MKCDASGHKIMNSDASGHKIMNSDASGRQIITKGYPNTSRRQIIRQGFTG